jgi:hypothetical protein
MDDLEWPPPGFDEQKKPIVRWQSAGYDFLIQPIAWIGRRLVTIPKLNRNLRKTSKSSSSVHPPEWKHAYRIVEFSGSLIRSCLQVLIAFQIDHIKNLDTPVQNVYTSLNSHIAQSPGKFSAQTWPFRVAMRMRLPKVLKAKPQKEPCPFTEAFLFME